MQSQDKPAFGIAQQPNYTPYLTGLFGMYCINEQRPLYETNCSLRVTVSKDVKC